MSIGIVQKKRIRDAGVFRTVNLDPQIRKLNLRLNEAISRQMKC